MVLASAPTTIATSVLAAERLDNVPPDQRGWEWHYLKRLTRGGLFTLYGHTGAVTSVSFSPDGTRIVTGSDDGTAKVWDARTGTLLLELKGTRAAVHERVVQPGRHADRHRRWSMEPAITEGEGVGRADGDALLDLKGHTDRGVERVVQPGRHADRHRRRDVCDGRGPGQAKVWDARTGTLLLDLKGHACTVTSVAFSPDGTRIVTGGGWTVRMQRRRCGTRGRASTAARPQGAHDAGCRACRSARTARGSSPEVTTRRRRCGTRGRARPARTRRATHTRCTSVSFSPDGTRIVTGSWDQTAKVWDARTGTPLLDLKGHTDRCRARRSARTARGSSPASCDKTAKVWDARTGTAAARTRKATRARCSARRSARTARGSSPAVDDDGEGVGRADRDDPARTQRAHGLGARAWRSARTARGSSPAA